MPLMFLRLKRLSHHSNKGNTNFLLFAHERRAALTRHSGVLYTKRGARGAQLCAGPVCTRALAPLWLQLCALRVLAQVGDPREARGLRGMRVGDVGQGLLKLALAPCSASEWPLPAVRCKNRWFLHS